MTRRRLYRLRAVLLAAMVAAGLAGCARDAETVTRTEFVRPHLSADLRTCPAEPPPPAERGLGQRQWEAWNEAVRAAGAACRAKHRAVVETVEGRTP